MVKLYPKLPAMKKTLTVIIIIVLNVMMLSAQDTVGIRINRMYQENAQKRNWSLYVAPPPFSGHTLRIELGRVMQGRAGSIPPSFGSFDIGIQKHVSEHLALGIQFQYGHASAKDAILYNNDINDYSYMSSLSVSSLNGIVYGRYYYDIFLRSKWDSKQHPKYVRRMKPYRKLVFYSGLGIGYGQVKYTPSMKGDYQYPEIPSLQKFVFSIEFLGINYYFTPHWGVFGGFSFWLTDGIYRGGHLGVFFHP
jgi:hypothetical protein